MRRHGLVRCSALVLAYTSSNYPGLPSHRLFHYSALVVPSTSPDAICLSHSVDSLPLSYMEKSSVAFSRSIGMELDSEGSIMSTCTEYGF